MPERTTISEQLKVAKLIPFEGCTWNFTAFRLGVEEGITTKLKKEGSPYGSSIWIDWHNILKEPAKARINILVDLFTEPANDFRRSFTESFSRTQDVLESIQLYDEVLMQERKSKYSAKEIEELLRSGHLPRPEVVFIDADRPGLDIFFEQNGFRKRSIEETYPHAYSIPWDRLVRMAQEGDLPLF